MVGETRCRLTPRVASAAPEKGAEGTAERPQTDREAMNGERKQTREGLPRARSQRA